MNHKRILSIIGIIEILIGGITFSATVASLALGFNQKPLNVLIFVFITASISTLLGIGIIRANHQAYRLLLYFSSVILLSKLLILLDIIQLHGAFETSIPTSWKNLVSIFYHGSLIGYLQKREVRKIFSIP